uniref:Uncharacterized protein n=1 Tax=Glossina brevipalpis TaxID=37001 RepID=A0A1A9WZ98_9MUSC
MRNLVPVAHLECEVYKCLEELCDSGLVRRTFIPDGESSSSNSSRSDPHYSIWVNEISTNIPENEVNVPDYGFNSQNSILVASIAPNTENFTNVAEGEVSTSEGSSVNKSTEKNNLAALSDEIGASSEDPNDCIFTDNNDKVPLPMPIKVEHQMEPTKEN